MSQCGTESQYVGRLKSLGNANGLYIVFIMNYVWVALLLFVVFLWGDQAKSCVVLCVCSVLKLDSGCTFCSCHLFVYMELVDFTFPLFFLFTITIS